MKKFYLLPFDHRQSFWELIKASWPPSAGDIARAKLYKKMIYQAFQEAIFQGIKKEEAALLVDGWLGGEILLEARAKGFKTCLPLEKSGSEELEIQGDYVQQIEKFKPDYGKVLVRYNPEEDKALNKRQREKLVFIQKYLKKKKIQFMLELIVPAMPGQLKKVRGRRKYDIYLRPSLMVKALKELQQAGVRPAIWKLEGLETKEQMRQVGGQVLPPAGIIVLGREENKRRVEHWLRIGASFEKVVGLAVGRTVFEEHLKDYRGGKIKRREAITKIAKNYIHFIKIFEKARSSK